MDLAKEYNVVVIVPSHRRARFWAPFAAAVHDASSINAGVDALRAGHVGLAVLVNRYDGIDLPGDACRVLALDGLPEAYGAIDRLEALALEDSEAMVRRQLQRIEQGMGRGVRSNDDYCVVLLLGSRLTQRLYSAGAATRFSPATRAQLDLSRQVADMLHGRPFEELRAVVEQCLKRDPGWVTASRGALDGVGYDVDDRVSAEAVAQREAFDLAELRRYPQGAERLQRAIDSITDLPLRGWLKQQAAAYEHFTDPVEAQKMQTSALTDNRALLKPQINIAYTRLRSGDAQAKLACDYLTSRYASPDELLIGAAALLEELIPDPDPSAVSRFEQAVHDLGRHLGISAQRPERDNGEGPDVLWLLGNLRFMVIECKSGAVTDFISRHDVGQLSHSMDWFVEKYDPACAATPLLIHKVSTLHRSATARSGTRVLTFARLRDLREAVRKYMEAIAGAGNYSDPVRLAERLQAFGLRATDFVNRWTVPTRKV